MLVDSNILIDVATADPVWGERSRRALAYWHDRAQLVVNAIVVGELSVDYATLEEVTQLLGDEGIKCEDLSLEAAFLAGKCFLKYRRRGGLKRSPLPDFFIGAHAAVQGYRLLTRDVSRYRTYFPTLQIVSP